MIHTATHTKKIQTTMIAAWAVIGLFFNPTAARADTVVINAAADSYVQSGTPNGSSGSQTVMDLIDTRHGVIRFDLSTIPVGATVTSAILTLKATVVGSSTAVKNYRAHRILTDWVESTVTWNLPGSTAGTHYASAPSATTAVTAIGSYTWNVTADTASFVSGGSTNRGWRIVWSSNTSGTSKQVSFGSKENTTPANRPILTVTYTLPVSAPSSSSGILREGTISVINVVINDNGGTKSSSDFPLFVNGSPVASDVTNTFPAPSGVYIITETTDPGYKRTFSGDCDLQGHINLSPRDVRFCIITNDDIGAPIELPPVPPLIELVRLSNPTGLSVGPGQAIYTYTLRNIGAVTVTDITLVGDACAPLTLISGDTNANGRLETYELWTYGCASLLSSTRTTTIVATGWANGLIAVDIANSAASADEAVTAPLIHVTKIPNPLTLRVPGGNVMFAMSITNPGSVPLNSVTITDDTCGPVQYLSGDANGDAKLDPVEVWAYTCQARHDKTMTNTVTVSGKANGLIARDIAIATVTVGDAAPGFPDTGVVPFGVDETGSAVPTIDEDKGLLAPTAGALAPCASGTLMKLANDGDITTQYDTTLYFCGVDGNRYVFPDIGTYSSWYPDFTNVQVVGAETLAASRLAGNVTYRPGSRLLKIESDPKVYAVEKNGVLRWVTSEENARALYGNDWASIVIDVSASFFSSYRIGDAIALSRMLPGTPTPTPSCVTRTVFTAHLTVGSSASQVGPLQELLQCLGHLPIDVVPNGYFGQQTEEAVMSFQTANGIASVGYVGTATRDALNHYVAP